MARVFLGCPTYGGYIHTGCAMGLWGHPTGVDERGRWRHEICARPKKSSMLVANCNQLWCDALNERHEQRIDWFALLHADIEPQPWWLDTLIAEADYRGADILSAVSPIKDERGVTSCGIDDPSNPWIPWCRLTMKQVKHPSFPQTFDISTACEALRGLPDELRLEPPETCLLANTGCMVVRMSEPWAEDLFFEAHDRIVRNDGRWETQAQPEDWDFARKAAYIGLTVMQTTKVVLVHHGDKGYGTGNAWGLHETDTDILRYRSNHAAPQQVHA